MLTHESVKCLTITFTITLLHHYASTLFHLAPNLTYDLILEKMERASHPGKVGKHEYSSQSLHLITLKCCDT